MQQDNKRFSQQNQSTKTEDDELTKEFDTRWITNDKLEDDSMIEFTKKWGKKLAQRKMSTSQLRNIYEEITRIKTAKELNLTSVYLLRAKVSYAVGRSDKTKRKAMELFQRIFLLAHTHVNNQKTFNNFCNYMEALVAYHKYFENFNFDKEQEANE